MATAGRGIWDRPIGDVPVAIIDFETTGLNPGSDRVVEVSVIRLRSDSQPEIVLDTLVNPNRRMGATDIHGISDDDVADAPHFEDLAGSLVNALSGCVLAAYNVYFDIGFLKYELGRVGLSHVPPHLCLMYMRPMLGLGKRCSLEDACREHGISHTQAHAASADALAAARLWDVCRRTIVEKRLATFRDLASLKTYKFVDSFEFEPLATGMTDGLRHGRVKSRMIPKATLSPAQTELGRPQPSRVDARHSYWDALKTVVSDLNVSDDEVVYLLEKRRELGLTPEEYRCLHARAFASVLAQCVEDKLLDDRECTILRRLHQCLSKIGWAPGE